MSLGIGYVLLADTLRSEFAEVLVKLNATGHILVIVHPNIRGRLDGLFIFGESSHRMMMNLVVVLSTIIAL